MSNIMVEGKYPKGVQLQESLGFASTPAVPSRGLAVTYGADEYHGAVATAAGEECIGLISEDVVSGLPQAVVEFGQGVAQIGANISAQQPLATNADGQLVPAQPGQNVVAISMESQVYVAPGSFACVLVLGLAGFVMPGAAVTYAAASGAIAVQNGTVALDGAAALAMTLAAPTDAQDGTSIYIVALTAHAHTVTTPVDGIYGTKHIATFAAEGDYVELEAVNGTWMVRSIGGPTPAALS